MNELLSSILDIAKNMIDAEGSSLLLLDKENDDLVFYTVSGTHGDVIKGQRIPQGKGIAGSVAESGQSLIVNDPQNDDRFFDGIDKKSDFVTRNIMSVPMIIRDELVGVLEVVNAKNRDAFDDYDLDIAEYIAEQSAIAISNRQLYDDLSKRVDELQTLYDITQRMALAGDDENVLQMIVESLASLMNAERVSIILYDPIKKKLHLDAATGLPDVITLGHEVDILNSVSGFVFNQGDPLLVKDIHKDMPERFFNTERHYKSNSFISIPIVYNNGVIGVINVTDSNNNASFDAYQMRLLGTMAGQVAEVHQNILNRRRLDAQKKLEQEIEIASDIQKRVLPDLPESIHGHSLAGFNIPARDVGGDFYDLFTLSDKKWALLVADISGKGMPAALFMGTARNIIKSETRIDASPGNLMKHANRYIFEESNYGMFVTAFYVVIDNHNRIISYTRAGHNNQLLMKKKTMTWESLTSEGKALGLIEDVYYEEKVVSYEPGDMLLLYTDGVTEQLGGEDLDIDLGEELLAKKALQHMDDGPKALIDELYASIESRVASAFTDDFTIVAVQFEEEKDEL